jgi:hypothetical protein
VTEFNLADQGTHRARARLARAVILIAAVSLVIGIANAIYQSRTKEPWRARIVGGEPIEVRFLCGANAVVDCGVSVRLTYRKQDGRWCEHIELSDRREISGNPSCNGDPEHGTISLLGVLHDFDRYGAVRVKDHLVGQLFPG